MIPEIKALCEALRYGSSKQVRGSLLFENLASGAEPEKNPQLREFLDCLAEKSKSYSRTIAALSYQDFALFDTTGDRRTFEAAYFERRSRLVVYALASWLWNKREDIRALEDTIWAICDEYSWCLPAHMNGTSLLPGSGPKKENGIVKQGADDNTRRLDLFSCETGFALAECCAMLETVLSPLVVERARNEVFRRLIHSYLENGAAQHWELLKLNWCAVCGGSLGGAACYLIEDDMLLGGFLHKILPTIDRFLDSFTTDGACTEGLSYWHYGVSFFVVFADLLFRRTAGRIDLLADRRFEKIARFQQACYLSGGAVVNFSDAVDNGFSPGLTAYLKDRIAGITIPPPAKVMPFNRGGNGHFAPALRELLWTAREITPFKPERNAAFPDAQWLLCSAGDISFAAKGGHNDEPHNHNDVGTFIYYKKGKMLLADLGSGEYVKDYFNENRYTIFCNQSLSHNLPLVAAQGQKPGRDFCARGCVFGEDGTMSLDIAPAYGIAGLESLRRAFSFNDAGKLAVEDCFGFSGKSLAVTERFVSLYPPRVQDGKVVIDAGDGARGRLACSLSVQPLISEKEHKDHEGIARRVFLVDFPFMPEGPVFSVSFAVE